MRQRRLPTPAARAKDPLLHRGLYAQIVGGLIVAALVVGIPLAWTKLTADDPVEVATKQVGQLSAGVTRARYEELLGGPPAIVRPVLAAPDQNGTQRPTELREAIWVADLYAVQAVLGPADQVLGYSVTTRSPDFRPPLERFDGHRLGAARFTEVLPADDYRRPVDAIGTPRGVWWYTEASEASGATAEDTILFTASDASDTDLGGLATIEIGIPYSTDKIGPLTYQDPRAPEVARLRELPISTYSILGPRLSLRDLPEGFRFGPTREDIWAVRPPPR